MNSLSRPAQICTACVALACLLSGSSPVSSNSQRGEKTLKLPVNARNPEICVIPKHFAGAAYSDKDLKDEENLCAIEVASAEAVCPKTNSTNPGLDIYSLPAGATPKAVQDAHCKLTGAKKIAKYKLSTSCSYTPSILGYYHLSRMLNGVGEVPPAVLRTFDLQNHIALGHVALSETPPTSLIHQTWAGLMAQLTAGPAASKRDLLLTADFTQSYGALSMNPTKELFYSEFFNGGPNNVARAQKFRDTNPLVISLANKTAINKQVGTTFTAATVQKMVQLKDISDMIVIDYLMNQQDRFGNIHYVMRFYYLSKNAGDNSPGEIVVSDKLKPDEVAQLGAVQVKKMMLKDNDCGVSKQNIAKQTGLIARVAHMDPHTYERVMRLNAAADSPETTEYFVNELLFTAGDYVAFRNNLKELASTLHDACAQGRLALDLDLQTHFSNQVPQNQSCEVSAAAVTPTNH